MANRIVKIEDICHVVKGETGIMKAIPGEYPMVVLSEERKTHNKYQFDCKAVIIPLVSSTGHGHASMKRIHYQEGKFALGSILCALIPKNEGEYDPEYLYHILDMGKERIFVPLMKGMANVSLPLNRIKTVEINLPPYDEQVRQSKIYSEVTTNLDLLRNQTDKQHKYLKQLRQSILQMAVQGKLTAQWREENPNVEPASVLLEKIKEEKEKLIKEGKIRREKPFPKITVSEKVFELPSEWEWARLVDYGITNTGTTPSKDNPEYFGNNYPFVKPAEISLKGIKYDTEDGLTELGLQQGRLIPKNSVLMVCIGGSIGKSYFTDRDVSCNQQINTITPLLGISSEFLHYFLQSEYFQKTVWSNASGATTPIVNKGKWEQIAIPMLPFDEQNEIVSMVNQLMKLCDELEKKIEKRDSDQERIMQAVVKQAFTTKIETVETE
ncbi:MAG: hypothetical protein GXX78_00535 [Bacteroidales bacterium]|nr:hypothetical protein [Bacteroidales bacterium]